MSCDYRRAYIDDDTYLVLDHAIRYLAPFRGCESEQPGSGWFNDPDLLHLLASLTLHAQTWLFHTIEDILNDDEAYLDHDDIAHILAGATPNPVGWMA